MVRIMTEEDDCYFEGRTIRFSDSAFDHMRYYKMREYVVCDMLKESFECPKRKESKGTPFRKTSRRVCANRDNETFSIVLDPYEYEGRSLWSVSHLKPI